VAAPEGTGDNGTDFGHLVNRQGSDILRMFTVDDEGDGRHQPVENRRQFPEG
jgi:hypothetical protein